MVDSHPETELRAAIEAFFFGFRGFTALPDEMLAELGFGRTHHRILYFVGRDPDISVGALLGILGISKQAANVPVRALEAQGLLKSRPASTDRRVRELRLTAKGRALEAQLSGIQMQALADAFATAGAHSEAGWRAVMSALASKLDAPNRS